MLLKGLITQFQNPHAGWLMLAMTSTLAAISPSPLGCQHHCGRESPQRNAIGFLEYMRIGVPVTLITLAIGCCG